MMTELRSSLSSLSAFSAKQHQVINGNKMMLMKCNACGRAGGFKDFFGNHWLKDPDDAYKRCKECVKEGRFNASGSWMGTPKDPPQILFERGWIDPAVMGKGKEAFNLAYPPEDVGKLVVDQPDRELLLENFDIAGHYGYGGSRMHQTGRLA